MRKKMERLAERFEASGLYFTESPSYNLDLDGNKYFLCWKATQQIAKGWRTQAEAIEGMKDILLYGLILNDGSRYYIVEDILK